MHQGYYRYPAVYKTKLAFASEDDIWLVPQKGGVPRRLTTGLGSASHPVFSPDGRWIAFAGTDEGHSEVYVIPSRGGPAERLTYLGDQVQVVNWTDEGIIFSSSSGMPFSRVNRLYTLDLKDKHPKAINIGPANHISYGPDGGTVIQRHGYREYGYWKRYRGGTAGNLWIDRKGDGQYVEFISLKGNLFRPLWIKDRIYFISDHEDIGNIYSCSLDGQDLKRHTNHKDFYVRYMSTDGKTITYSAGGDVYTLPVGKTKSKMVGITFYSPRTQRARKLVSAAKYLDDYSLSPRGDYLTAVSRGKAYFFSNWEGPTFEFGVSPEARYRVPRWLNDGQRILIVSDEDGEEHLEIYKAQSLKRLSRMPKPKVGRVIDMMISPTGDEALLSNHRCELIHVDLKTWKTKVLDKSGSFEITGFDWSPDGIWAAYSFALSSHQWIIKLVNVKTGEVHEVTEPVLKDVAPSFDPDGQYLYFLSYREFNPYRDSLHFEYGFPKGMKPYLVTLQKELQNPFVKRSTPLKEKAEKKQDKEKITIDLEGISKRIVAFPVDEGHYSQIVGLKGKVLISTSALQGTLDEHDDTPDDLEVYDFETHQLTTLYEGISEFDVNHDRSHIIYRVEKKLRVGKAGEKPEHDSNFPKFSKKNGWLDLSRMKVMIDPTVEWRQIYRESWRLQRDHFWREDMSEINWNKVFKMYEPMLDRIGTREELSDVMWEMQGELGTSHAYVMGGDTRRPPHYGVGTFAADFEFVPERRCYQIKNIAHGDSWQEKFGSPFNQPGINVKDGDLLWAVNGKPCNRKNRPESHLIGLAGQEVEVTVSDPDGKNKRHVMLQTMRSQYGPRYREWVEKNRAYVHEKTDGKLGYIHIPDMSPWGFSEFHRGFLAELSRDGLVVDVRFNGGGHVSQLLLEKLARRRLGYDQCRWFGLTSYPEDAPHGPMVCLTNEYAGSDGDMFSHVFKMMKLGPLLGKRTWGGVIGIWPRHSLVDGGMTTQPEFSFWFKDVGWSIENYGVDPDIEVEYTPQDYATGKDPQLDRSIEETLKLLKSNPPLKSPRAA